MSDTSRGSALEDNPLNAPDLEPLEGENADLRQEAREVIGEWWLKTPNAQLGGQSPDDVISGGHGAMVRDIIRSVKYIGVS